ncbi:type IV toxin-antitoxin system AbiEi family antitoxin domain-containing protein [Blastococcus sp. SYSU D00695]
MTSWEPPDLVLRRTALAEGWSDEELSRRIRRGELTRVRPGAYVLPDVARDAGRRHRRLVDATLAALRRPAVVSHQSAAVVHGLPLWGAPLGRVHVTRTPPATAEVGRALHCHVARLREDDVVVVDGIVVTVVVRTALDLARTLPFEAAVVTLDVALHQHRLTPADLTEGLGQFGRVPGVRSAARAVRFADGRSESVGESRSRVLLHQLGLAPSTLQHDVVTAGGVLLGRADFAWEAERVVGEFDGRVKYGRLLRPGQDPGDAVFEEKLREDVIRDEDWGVVRWTWPDLTPQVLGPRVHRALERGRRRRA